MHRKPLHSFLMAIVVALTLAGCGGGSGEGSGGGALVDLPNAVPLPTASPTASPQLNLRGVLTYDSVPVTPSGLDYAHIVQRPIRGAVVQLVDGQDNVVSAAVTDASGNYSFAFDAPSTVKVRVLSQTSNPVIVVQDNTNGNAVYSMVSPLVDATKVSRLNLNADAGGFVAGQGYTRPRVAGPFAVLDTCYKASLAVLAVRPDIALPRLPVNWSVNNAPSGKATPGETDIGTSHYTSATRSLFILGKENVDTDEYDVHILVHEWGHYFENEVSRSDGIGGPHGAGDVLDPRVAFGEGYGNALSGMINYPDAVYKDTNGLYQADVGPIFNLQDPGEADPVPGWFSEASVQTILYRIFAPPTPPYDNLGLGLKPVIDVLTGPEKTTPGLTTIFTFINGLQEIGATTHAQIDPLLAAFSMTPIVDDFGTGQTTDGGWNENLPVYRDLPLDDNMQHPVPTRKNIDADGNKRMAIRYLKFEGTGATLSLHVLNAAGTHAVTVYASGRVVANVEPVESADQTIPVETVAGQTYVVVLSQTADAPNATLTPSLQLSN